jgi:hypothetical protein
LAPFGDAEQLRELIESDVEHRALYQVFLDVRDAAARILENTSLADIIKDDTPIKGGKKREKPASPARIVPIAASGNRGRD